MPGSTIHKNILLLLIGSLLMFSCVKDVDFDQAETFELTPVVDVSLVHFDISASQIGEAQGNSLGYTFSDNTNIDVFSESYFDDSLQEADFIFEFTNTIARSFSAEIILYNASGNPIDDISVDVSAFENVTTERKYNESEIQTIKDMERIEVSLTLDSGTPELTPDSEGALLFKSAATFHMSIDDDQ
ncbi:hypothetical protein OOZ15_06000 [Galbibacter sp. EGI 63066]|uniref:hypothetical protein n=1 Tax=Galbibacter sp. EGI 63066 TaxID=2993559 RepID=UPI0022494C72|nr:hypothetical protein [Galbibacter sp. EGI 63066]MCX2679490.1 hypothetical protein [Galbibacter sp. EGI 63066]